ncbi:TIGR01777 family oxidoreductase [Lentzea terrae]|uniref:TIGR01777 family oxidoreductase n=1 Tax=Lentzea terrae TaxID=2200761 RepID=UPI000DD2E779|nr:TIGR01777 family oxidoreductase [Lentzea terrae]
MKIVIPGGTGQIGGVLRRALTKAGHEVVIVSRSSGVRWDGRTLGAWAREVDGADVVVNLAGRSVSCRYTKENLAEMMRSRVESARVVGEAIAKADNPPKVWLQMSTATIYAHRFDAPNDEVSGIIGGHEPGAPGYWAFSIDIAKNWEAELDNADTPHTRKVALRAAMVMSPDRGGAFDHLSWIARLGLGGAVGGGRQYMSWIHDEDFVRAIALLIREPIAGPVNLAAPNPLSQQDFMRDLRKAWRVPVGLPATRWMAEIGAAVIGTDTELLLKSRRVVPTRLREAGFEFHFPNWAEAAQNLVERRR